MGVKTVFSVVLLSSVLVVGGLMPLSSVAAPVEPALVSKSWEFKFSFDTPRPIAVRNLAGDFEWFWYMSYKVVNNSGEERLFIPEITIASDRGDIFVAGRGVRSAVFDAIKARLGNRLLESPNTIVGQILQGEDHAKEGVAIWPATEHNIDNLSIFVAGLSGETALIKVPDPADTTKSIDTLVAKTLMLDYELPGFPRSPQEQPVIYKGQKWIMR